MRLTRIVISFRLYSNSIAYSVRTQSILRRGDWHDVTPAARAACPSVSPLHQLEGVLRKPVAFLIVPIVGFANAGVWFTGVTAATLIEPLKDQRDQAHRAPLLQPTAGEQSDSGVILANVVPWVTMPKIHIALAGSPAVYNCFPLGC
ncbi:Na+/H+ antiporter NhaA [Massilia violaceinigra]|uniref:Na+/H+ antiporter NhaA n=1 Tax=Massilia violaceinigra TaxID=2045208 RepID=UPI001FB317D5